MHSKGNPEAYGHREGKRARRGQDPNIHLKNMPPVT
jgi:hypothetical protein